VQKISLIQIIAEPITEICVAIETREINKVEKGGTDVHMDRYWFP
jgi:hypothetical protein